MADRYDPNSVANLDKFDSAGDSSTDTWAALVTHITGYPVPDRNTVFDTLRSDYGGKLFRMDIKQRGLGMFIKDSGFLMDKGEDYDIWFFDSGKKRVIMQARIVFEGRVKSGDEVIFAGPGSDNVQDAQVSEGNEFTDNNKVKMSTVTLARYMNGPRAALLGLLGGSTQDARFSNLSVPANEVVDLSSFDTTGDSFDYAAKFFRDHALVLKDWEDRFSRDDASWKGEAAEVFRGLLKKIRENYDSYVETFDSAVGTGDKAGTGNTVYSRALSLGRGYLEDSAKKLLEAWLAWGKSPYYDPLQVLRYVLDDLAQWVDANNIAKTTLKSSTIRYTTTVSHSPQAGFSQVHPEYGDLTDIANWAKVGDKAVKIWTHGVEEYLGKPAAQVQSALNNHFLELGEDFSANVPKPKSTTSAAEEYKERMLLEQKEEIDRQNEENQKYQDELRKEQNQQREEDRNYQDELREEQRREKEEAKREAGEQQKAMEESLGGLNDLNAVKAQNTGGLGDLPNQDIPVTESFGLGVVNSPGSPGGVNGQGGSGDLNDAIAESLGSLDALNSQGGENGNQTGMPPAGQNLGNFGALNSVPGRTNRAASEANEAITENLGSLNGAGGSLESPTGGSSELTGGKLTTDFADGSSSVFDPDSGLVTTTHPDGSVTTQDLGEGVRVTNPDGSVTSLGDDGKLTTTFPDGTTQVVDPATGRAVSTDPDGRTTTENLGSLGDLNGAGDLGDLGDFGNLSADRSGLETPTGGRTALVNDDFTTTYPDGSKGVFDPDSGMLTTTRPDGSTVTTDLTHGARMTNPDGSITVLDNGRLTTTFPDGSTQVIDPETGVATVTDPRGRTATVDLNSLNSLGGNGSSDILDSLDDLRDLNRTVGPDGTNGTGGGDGTTSRDVAFSELGLGSGQVGTGGFGGGLSGVSSFSSGGGGAVAPLSDSGAAGAGTPLAAGGGAGAGAGASGAPGMPGSPGMPMGGGMGGAGGGGEKGNGERVRAVLVDAAEESERRNRRRRSPWNRQEDSDTFLAPASRVATTGGSTPEGETEEPRRRSTSSADYLEEDADVWGTEEGGTPAVIGR